MAKYKVCPDIVAYNIILGTLVNHGDPKYVEEAENLLYFIEKDSLSRADSFTYNAVIKGSPPEYAERLIRHWELQYKRGKTDERPDSFSYSSLIKAWVKSNVIGYEEKCLGILDWMEQQQVVGMNRIVYNEVIRAFGRSTRSDAGDMAEEVFKRLLTRYEESRDREMKPDKFSYMALVNAFAWSSEHDPDNAFKAENVLFEMVDRRDLPSPDIQLCTNLIAGWARSGHPDAVVHAEKVCNLMDSCGIRMDAVVFNALINVYAKSSDPNGAMKVLGRMHDRRIDPTSVSYTPLIEACSGNEDQMVDLFEDCIRRGMLDEKVRSSFLEHGPPMVQEKLSGDIPREWSRSANRGPAGKSRNQIKYSMQRGSTGEDIRRFGWAR
jgi:pentatricopeptide repeat protein